MKIDNKTQNYKQKLKDISDEICLSLLKLFEIEHCFPTEEDESCPVEFEGIDLYDPFENGRIINTVKIYKNSILVDTSVKPVLDYGSNVDYQFDEYSDETIEFDRLSTETQIYVYALICNKINDGKYNHDEVLKGS